MNISRNEREELKGLSKEVFGKPSFWQRLYHRGAKRTKAEALERGTSYKYFFGFEDIKAYMLTLKEANAKFMAEMKAKAEENALNEKNSPPADPKTNLLTDV